MPPTRRSFNKRYSGAKRKGRIGYANIVKRRKIAPVTDRTARKVNSLMRMIETKEGQWSSQTNVQLPHNQIYIVLNANSVVLNPFQSVNGTDDPMGRQAFSRIGDEIYVKGMRICMFLENAINRAKVHYRIMLLKCPRGVTIDRATLFKGCSNNKMIDTVNTERFQIIWQKRFNMETANPAPTGVGPTGVPTGTTSAGQATRVIEAWVPGKKFGNKGKLSFEDATAGLPKFFDYRFVILSYDWFGTPQDANNVGVLNEMYTKVYFKDA